jgi:primosomal protein N' (replication factor Y)
MKCHYCGYSVQPFLECPACHHDEIHFLGTGTEKIEEELQILLPQARVARLDLDTTRTKHGFHQIIESFENREIDILVGTQMVTKGLDFGHVSLVGIMNADIMMSFPDFRAHERAFQLMSQVGGRAGRGHTKGKVIIQTSQPGHPLIQQVMEHQYEGFYQSQITERKEFYYPPFCRMIKVTAVHKYEEYVSEAITTLFHELNMRFKGKLLGPETPMVGKIRNEYLKEIIIKFDRGSTREIRELLRRAITSVRSKEVFKQVRWLIDADPY